MTARTVKRFILPIVLLLSASPHATSQDKDSLLCAIYEQDQGIRRTLMQAYSGAVSQDSLPAIVMRMAAIDRQNQQTVFALLEGQGWPEGLSGSANQAIFLVIDHADLSHQQKYLPLIRAQADKGTIEMSAWATLYDRVSMGREKEQVYGTQTVTFFDKSQGIQLLYLWPVQNPSDLDIRRSEVGLSPIQDYLDKFSQMGMSAIWDKTLSVKKIAKTKAPVTAVPLPADGPSPAVRHLPLLKNSEKRAFKGIFLI